MLMWKFRFRFECLVEGLTKTGGEVGFEVGFARSFGLDITRLGVVEE